MRILVAGSAGQLGTELSRKVLPAGLELFSPDESDFDITSGTSVAATVRSFGPDVVVNAAAYTAVDRAEEERELAFEINEAGPGILADECAGTGAALVHVSTDYVFDGTKESPYAEDDDTNPINVYGGSKAAGELAVRARCRRHVIVRTSWVYSSYGNNFVKTILRLATEREELSVIGDQIGAPTSTVDLAEAILKICARIDGRNDAPWGTFHYTGGGQTSWFGFAEHIVERQAPVTGRRPELLEVTTAERPGTARRPANSRLDCSKIGAAYGVRPVHWRAAVDGILDRLLGDPSEPASARG